MLPLLATQLLWVDRHRWCSRAGTWHRPALSLLMQVVVVYTPVLQQAFSTVPLTFSDWLRCAAAGSSVLWLRELSKVAIRMGRRFRAAR